MTVNSYNANGWLTEQDTYNGSAQIQSRTSYTAYDNLGNVLNYQTSILSGYQYTNYYSIQYAKYDSYKQTVVSGTSTYLQPGSTTNAYDINGNLIAVSDQFDANKYRSFVVPSALRTALAERRRTYFLM